MNKNLRMKIAPPRINPFHELACKEAAGVFRKGRNYDFPRLTTKAERWLERNTTGAWWIRPGNSETDTCGPIVGFESTRDAALFKVFWT